MSFTKQLCARIMNKLLKNLLTIFCLTCFLWQTIELYTEFMNGKTVTNISVGVLHNQTLPAITLCSAGLDLKQISKINPQLGQFYVEYLDLIRGANKSTIESLEDKIYENYLQTKNIFFASIGEKPIGEIFANYSTHFNKQMINVKLYKVISSGFIGKDLVQMKNEDVYEVISNPIETISIFNSGRNRIVAKCFTLFSHCTSGWSDITIDFNSMIVNVWFDIESMPLWPSSVCPIMVHSPNALPDFHDGFKLLKLGSDYQLDISQWKIERLGKGYDTNCKDYDPKSYTRSECILDCYRNTSRGIHNINDFVPVPILVKQDFFESKKNFTLSYSINKNIKENEIYLNCMEKCHKECQFRYYPFTLNKYMDSKNWMNLSIDIVHSQMPDLQISHIPKMPLMTFICNFGGLLGMWLGVSFVTILAHLWPIISMCVRQMFLSVKININFYSNNINRIHPESHTAIY